MKFLLSTFCFLLCLSATAQPLTLNDPAFVANATRVEPANDVATTQWVTNWVGSPIARNETYIVGCKITMTATVTVRKLSRWKISGNTGTHNVGIFNSSGTLLGSVSIDASAGTDGALQEATLGTPLTLNSGTSYYLLGDEYTGDLWYDIVDNTPQVTAVATLAGAFSEDSWGSSITMNDVAPNVMYHRYSFGYDLMNNIAAWWRFNEGSGASVADSSGNGNTLYLTNSPTWQSGYIELNGTDEFAEDGSAGNYTTEAFTVMGWFNPVSVTNNPVLFGNGIYQENGYYFQPKANNTIDVIFNLTDNNSAQSTTAEVTTNEWQHFALVREDASVIIYRNGVSINSGSTSMTSPASAGSFRVGAYKEGIIFYEGALDDVRIYSINVASGTISAIYSEGRK